MALPKPKVFWPLTISASNRAVYVKVGSTDYTANIATGTYLSAADLATAVQTTLQSTAAVGIWTVTVNTDGKFVIANDSFTFEIRFGAFTSNTAAALLGFFSINIAAASSQTAAFQHANGWYAEIPVRKDSLPTFDREMDRQTVSVGGQNKLISEVELTRRRVVFAWLKPWKTFIARESLSGTRTNEAMERWWREGAAKFRYWPDASVEGTFVDYFLDQDSREKFEPDRQLQGLERYELELRFRGYVA